MGSPLLLSQKECLIASENGDRSSPDPCEDFLDPWEQNTEASSAACVTEQWP